MGDWRRVQVIGTCGAADTSKLKAHLNCTNHMDDSMWDRFGPLSHAGTLGAVPNWAREQFDAIGTLAERGFSPEEVKEQLEKLVEIAPSLKCRIHVGELTTAKCEATVVVVDGKVEVCDPEVEEVPDAPTGQFESDLFAALSRKR